MSRSAYKRPGHPKDKGLRAAPGEQHNRVGGRFQDPRPCGPLTPGEEHPRRVARRPSMVLDMVTSQGPHCNGSAA